MSKFFGTVNIFYKEQSTKKEYAKQQQSTCINDFGMERNVAVRTVKSMPDNENMIIGGCSAIGSSKIVAIFNANNEKAIQFIGNVRYDFSIKRGEGVILADGGLDITEKIYETLIFE